MPKSMRGVMEEFETHTLHSGKGGKVVTNPKQAVAIGLSEQRQLSGQGKRGGGKHKTALHSPVSGKFGSGGGFSTGSHKPRVLNNPSTLEGRRSAARAKAYGPPED